MLSQGTDTFDDIKLKLADHHAKGATSFLNKATSRRRRAEALDIVPNGAEVGKYYPRFHEVEKRIKSQTFAGRYNFLTDEERKKKV